jgi:uncharacterized protein (TIGR01777 family)
MNISITGGTGFIGRKLVDFLKGYGHNISLISREDFKDESIKSKLLGQEIIINLAGETITGRWTKRKKKKIYDSRIKTTKALVESININNSNIRLIISISAVGVYDDINIHDENSVDYANNFLAKLIKDWEDQLKGIVNKEIRIVILRLGIVLAKDGGLIEKVLLPFKMGIGIIIQSNNGFPFIHINDLLRVFQYIIENKKISGIVNAVAPGQTNITSFFNELNRIKKTVLKVKINEQIVRLLLGESAITIIEGQIVLPSKLEKSGFHFNFKDINSTLKNLLTKK